MIRPTYFPWTRRYQPVRRVCADFSINLSNACRRAMLRFHTKLPLSECHSNLNYLQYILYSKLPRTSGPSRPLHFWWMDSCPVVSVPSRRLSGTSLTFLKSNANSASYRFWARLPSSTFPIKYSLGCLTVVCVLSIGTVVP